MKLLFYFYLFFLVVPVATSAQEPVSSKPDPVILGQPQGPVLDEAYDLAMTRGMIHLHQRQFEEAQAAFQAAIAIRKNDTDALYLSGLTAVRQERCQDAEQAFQLAIQMGNKRAAFELGVCFYLDGGYEKAISVLEKAAAFDPDNPVISFYQGRLYKAMKKEEVSIAFFLRAARMAENTNKPLAADARYLAGLFYFKQNALKEARAEFEKAIATNATTKRRQSVSNYIKRIDDATAQRVTFVGNIAYQYDDNVMLESSDGVDGIGRSADSRLTIYMGGDILLDRSGYRGLGVGYSLYQNLHADLTQFNTQSHKLNLYLPYQKGGVKGKGDYLFHFITVDNDPYLQGHALRANAIFPHGTNRATRIDYKFQWNDFKNSTLFPINSDREGMSNDLTISESLQWAKWRGNIGYSTDFSTARGDDWEYTGHRFFIGGKVLLPFSLEADLDVDYTNKSYHHPSSFSSTRQKRQDHLYEAEVGLRCSLLEKGKLSLQYTSIRNDSNLSPFDYRRGVTSINFMKRF